VKDIDLDLEARQVVIEVECQRTVWADETGQWPIHGYEAREWVHLDTMQFRTVIRTRVPRVRRAKRDEETGEITGWETRLIPVPWAEPRSRWTTMFEAFAVRVLSRAKSVQGALEILRIGWEAAQGIMNRAVERGLASRGVDNVYLISLEETSFGRGQDAVTVLVDILAKRVLEVTPGKDAAAGCAAIGSLPEEQREAVKAACIDMSKAYEKALGLELPQALLVHDKYHVSALFGAAVDQVRREEHRGLLATGDDRLKGLRFDFLYDPAALSAERLDRLEKLLRGDLKTARAYGYRLNFLHFWEAESGEAAQEVFARWYRGAIRSRLKPIKKLAKTLKEHLPGLLNYFAYRITNGLAECINGMIQNLKRAARGFRNFGNFRTRILFFLGRLQLEPETR
jgi:transposase